MVKDISKYIDYTLLKAEADAGMFEKLCQDAKEYGFFCVCVPPYAVKGCRLFLGEASDIKITTVIGFPLGYNCVKTKVFEITDAIACGADEIDAVINLSAFKSGRFDYVSQELKELRRAAGKNILKIIIETCYLSPEEIVRACGIVCESGADYVKTSTGFGSGGAVIEDVELMSKSVYGKVKIKASGGIKTFGQALSLINAGASRIGTSSILSVKSGSAGTDK